MKLAKLFNRTEDARRSKTTSSSDSSGKRTSCSGEDSKPLPQPPPDEDEAVSRLVILPTDSTFTPLPYPSIENKRFSLAFDNFPVQTSLRVLVVGCGFAGLSAAIAAARQGYDVTVLERSTGISQHGDSVILGSNATLLLHRWGCGEELWLQSSRGKYMVFKDSQGKTLHKEDLEELPSRYGAPLLQGKRSQFLASLGVQARLLGVRFEYNREVVGYDDSSDRPGVILENRELRRADVIIVCDGINSTSRTLLPQSGEKASTSRRSSGYSIHRAVIDSDVIARDPACSYLLDGDIRTWLGDDAHVSIYPIDSGRQIAFTYTHKDVDGSSSLDWRSLRPISTMLDSLKEWDESLQKALSKFTKVLHWQILEGDVQEEWVSKGGKICFGGDAVHPLVPTSIQGASQSVEDGATIALCLSLAGGNREGIVLALKAYEQIRKPRVELAARLGRKQLQILHTFTLRNSPYRTSQRFSWYESSPVPSNPSNDDGGLNRLSAFIANPCILRPLSFQLYGFDAEEHARSNWDDVVREVIQARHRPLTGLSKEMEAATRNWAQTIRSRKDSCLAFPIESFNPRNH
ncbi:hypothetical protein JCM5353_008947 [Sporobolomyces roseus]